MPEVLPSPTNKRPSLSVVLEEYLDYFRHRVVEKVSSLSEEEARRSELPSGWSPIELVKHLRFVEQRWLVWGFEGAAVSDPWGDQEDGRWRVGPEESLAVILGELRQQGAVTRRVIESHDLSEVGRPGPRWDGADPASLERVLLHLLQEYARHLGHLDVVVELRGAGSGD